MTLEQASALPYTQRPVLSVSEAQRNNAQLFRQWARRAPWNSKARREWEQLAASAEHAAAAADDTSSR